MAPPFCRVCNNTRGVGQSWAPLQWVCAVGAGARPTLLVHGVHLASLYVTVVALAQVRINTRRIPTHRFPESLLIPLSLSCPRCAGYWSKVAHAGQSWSRKSFVVHALHGQSFSTRHRRSTSEPSTQYEPCVGWSCNGARLLLAPPRSPASCEPDLHRTAHLDSCTQTRPRGGPCLQHCWGQRGVRLPGGCSVADNLFNGVQRCTATPTARTQRPIRPPADYSHVPLSPSGASRLY